MADTEDIESLIDKSEFNAAMDEQYPHGCLTKTMRVDRRDRITGWLRGDLSPPQGNWKYRIINRGYATASFPELGEKDILCLKGPQENGVIEQGRYGEWRKVIGVEEFYDILLDKHVRQLNHGGYRVLLKAIEKDYAGMTRSAALRFISLCKQCSTNPIHQPRPHRRPRKTLVKLTAITRNFNRRCQVDILDMTLCPDGQYTHVGVYTDHWTKFVTLFPMTGSSVEHVSFGLASSVYPYYGPPHFLHAADGVDFAERVVENSIDKWKGGARTVFPRAKGPLLHMGGVMEKTKELLISLINGRAIRDLPEGGQLTWASWLGNIMYAINNQQPETSTGKSAYSRVFQSAHTADVTDSVASGQRSAGESSTSRKRKNSSSDEVSVALTSNKASQPAARAKLTAPCTFVAIKNHK